MKQTNAATPAGSRQCGGETISDSGNNSTAIVPQNDSGMATQSGNCGYCHRLLALPLAVVFVPLVSVSGRIEPQMRLCHWQCAMRAFAADHDAAQIAPTSGSEGR